LKLTARLTGAGSLIFQPFQVRWPTGESVEEAKAKAYALALYAVADDVEKSKDIPDSISIFPASA